MDEIMEIKVYEKFEYTVLSFRDSRTSAKIEKLNEMGNDGWELVNIINNNYGTPEYIFKRKLECKQYEYTETNFS